MNDDKKILVMGATGQQGGAVARRLLSSGWAVRILTRNAQSAAAQALAKKGAEIATGDMDDRVSLDKAMAGVHGVFSVQTFQGEGGVEAEERQGKTVADAVKDAGVKHLVYTSVGGAERQTGIPHFDSKWRIEEHIRRLGVPATILRPVFFMENLNMPLFIRMMMVGTLERVLGRDKPLQMIATSDIGELAVIAFERRNELLGKAIELAGDSLTPPQMSETWRRVTGKRLWSLPIPMGMVRRMPEEMSKMMIWFGEKGYDADIPALRKLYPGLLTFEQWLSKRQTAAA